MRPSSKAQVTPTTHRQSTVFLAAASPPSCFSLALPLSRTTGYLVCNTDLQRWMRLKERPAALKSVFNASLACDHGGVGKGESLFSECLFQNLPIKPPQTSARSTCPSARSSARRVSAWGRDVVECGCRGLSPIPSCCSHSLFPQPGSSSPRTCRQRPRTASRRRILSSPATSPPAAPAWARSDGDVLPFFSDTPTSHLNVQIGQQATNQQQAAQASSKQAAQEKAALAKLVSSKLGAL